MSNRCNFLIIHYEEMDFILNRTQITGSVSNIESRKISCQVPHVKEVIMYGNRKLLSVDLDSYLRYIFGIKEEPQVKLSVIVDVENFSKFNRETILKIIDQDNIACDSRYISFSLTSRSEIRKLDITTLRLFPDTYRERYIHSGLIGCRFPEDNRVQYFADIENLFFNSLLNGEGSIEKSNNS